jgi:hypothetical protein
MESRILSKASYINDYAALTGVQRCCAEPVIEATGRTKKIVDKQQYIPVQMHRSTKAVETKLRPLPV